METDLLPPKVVRLTAKVRDLPEKWRAELPGDPEAEVAVVITAVPPAGRQRPLTEFLGIGRGAYANRAEADEFIRALRAEWRD